MEDKKKRFTCPCGSSEFLEGPHGGVSVNFCCNICNRRFNDGIWIDEEGFVSMTDKIAFFNGPYFPTGRIRTAPPLGCMDCGLLYSKFPLDVHLPRSQWLLIHENEGGVLCAQCIVTRAAKIPGCTVVHAILEISPRSSDG